jgi:hypothetical protein
MASTKPNINSKSLIEKDTYSYSCQTETKETAVLPAVM